MPFAALLGAVLFGERPSAWTGLGALLILIGSAIAIREGRRAVSAGRAAEGESETAPAAATAAAAATAIDAEPAQ